MAKADREPIIMYAASCPGLGEWGMRMEWGAIDVAAAARVHANWLCKNGCRLTREGPLFVVVLDPSTSKTWEVTVDVRIEPVFEVTKEPRLVK